MKNSRNNNSAQLPTSVRLLNGIGNFIVAGLSGLSRLCWVFCFFLFPYGILLNFALGITVSMALLFLSGCIGALLACVTDLICQKNGIEEEKMGASHK